MKKPEEPYIVLDWEEAFPNVEDPEWLKKMLAASRKYFAQPVGRETSQKENPVAD